MRIFIVAAGIMVLVCGPAAAQNFPLTERIYGTPNDAVRPNKATIEEIDAVRELNSKQAEAAAKENADYNARLKAFADEKASSEAAYRKALADHAAQVADMERRAAEEKARWEAAVLACRQGHRDKCAR